MLINLHSYYSLRYGTLSLEKLIEGMLQHGYDTAVLTDINNSTGSLDFLAKGNAAGLNILAGMEFRNSDQLLYIGIAQNNEGFRELNECMTTANQSAQNLPLRAPEFQQVYIVYPFGSVSIEGLRDNEYIGIRPSELTRIRMEPPSQYDRYVILSPVSFGPTDYKLHAQLRAIEHNLLISHLQRYMVGSREEVFIPKSTLMQLYRDFPQIIRNTNQLLARCTFNFDFKKVKNKTTFTGNRTNDRQLLQKYTLDGFTHRYGNQDKVALQRIRRELEIIEQLNFSSYFLITDDICRYARNKKYHYVGRGSGANSAVAYCLGITDVDPIELNLPFERFLNPKRKSPPDFDVDFSWKDRDDMYDYIFNRYQSGHTALMGAMSTFRSKSILRELGKVYGLPKNEIDRLIEDPENVLNKNEITRTILSVYNQVVDFPNQRTIHSSGVLISELPLTYYSALDYPPKGLPTVQYDMYVAENIGFEKFDILSQRGIGHIKDCKDIVYANTGNIIDTSNPKAFFTDPKIAAQLKSANTIGCFYIESPAMRQLLTKLRCDSYLILVAASSIIRPGVSSSGMMQEYIKRHHDPSIVNYLHPVFKEQLEETYGVMVFQEDVMKIASAFGGLDMADADVLRRMMSGKHRNIEELNRIKERFFQNCKEKGIASDICVEVWRQIESFAGYSFNKAHSASYAVESYQSLFLKTYYPREFMVAVLNNFGGFYQRKVYINEARMAGATINLPCVNKSEFNTSIYDSDIYLGFDSLLNLEEKLAKNIVEERKTNGVYTSLDNFLLRTGASLEQLVILIRVGALRFTKASKKELLWKAHLMQPKKNSKRIQAVPLFETTTRAPNLPELDHSPLEDLYDEIELIGFTVSGSLFDLCDVPIDSAIVAADLPQYEGKNVHIIGDFVADKTVRTKYNSLMKFGTFLDRNGVFFDTVHFTQSLQKYPLRGAGIYEIEGKVVLEFGCPSLEVHHLKRLPLKSDPRTT